MAVLAAALKNMKVIQVHGIEGERRMTKGKLAIKLAIDIMERNVNKYINHGIYEVSDADGAVHVEFGEAINILNGMLEQQPCEDAINRQAVFESIEDDASNGVYSHFASYEDAQKFKETIKALSPVTPIRPKGEWETGYTYPDGEYWKCSECGELIKVKFPMNFCNSCGADMRGKKDEID